MNIYEQLNKINDKESLSEKYNVKNSKELKKLQESSKSRKPLKENLTDEQKEATMLAREYILDNYSWSDYDVKIDGNTLTVTVWYDDEWGEDSSERVFTLDINKLIEFMYDEDALNNYIENAEDYVNYDARGQEFYERAEKELENHFGCTNALLEPSTQAGQGGTFLFADDMSFEGHFDYQTGEDYIREDNFEGFLQLCLDSFTPRVEESLKESKSTKDRVEAAKQIIADLESKGFVNSDIAAIGTMIKETIDSRYQEYVSPRDRLRKKFPELNI